MAQQQIAASTFDLNLRVRRAALVPLAIALAIFTLAPTAQAQTLSVLHTFTGYGDGAVSTAGLTMDQAGNFYGTTSIGGAAYGTSGYGTVFKLSRAGSGWILRTIYTFQGGSDGSNPYAGVVFGPDGALYGTTSDSGDPEYYRGANHYHNPSEYGAGTVFRLTPPGHACESFSCPWTKTALYHFTGTGGDGAGPGYGNLTFDAAGNIYGTTTYGGNCDPYDDCGTVFKLTRSGESWTESVLYSFSQSGNQGFEPFSGVVLDSAGNVYGTTFLGGPGGSDGGAAYQLTQSGSSWTLTVLHDFGGPNDGGNPFGGMTIDQQGNLYGTTGDGPGSNDGGTVFEFQPSGDSWTYTTLAVLPSDAAPEDTPMMDAAGNLYATGVGGIVFKLTYSGGVWTYNLLHDLNGRPIGGVVMDANGNLYGTTEDTSGSSWGEVWELTP